ncbi:unnamed protein product, partial [marine sediment metagenome]
LVRYNIIIIRMYIFSKDSPSLISPVLVTTKSIILPIITVSVILDIRKIQAVIIKIMKIIGFENR